MTLDQAPPEAPPGEAILDAAPWYSLTGPHAAFAEGAGPVRRYPADVSPIVAVDPHAGPELWPELHRIAGPGGEIMLPIATPLPAGRPAGWETTVQISGVQFVATDAVVSAPDHEAVPLGPADAAEMADLVRRTEPGPFLPRTHLLGTYLGIRREGRLVAMAGERLHPPGWTEISAVCTEAAHRGNGYATRLVGAIAHGIRARGETPFLHTAASNATAIRLYEELGFRLRRTVGFAAFRAPRTPAP